MVVTSLENSEHYIWGEICDGWHLLKSKGLSVIQERVPPGGKETRHYHEHSHQFFFILSGKVIMEFDQKRVEIGPQQGISILPKTPHRLLNESQEAASFLVISSPMSHGDRVNLPD